MKVDEGSRWTVFSSFQQVYVCACMCVCEGLLASVYAGADSQWGGVTHQ